MRILRRDPPDIYAEVTGVAGGGVTRSVERKTEVPVFAASRSGSADWASRGACRDHDPDLFFLIAAADRALRQIAEAKAVCARCPVHASAYRYALETGQDAGVWGGTTEDE